MGDEPQCNFFSILGSTCILCTTAPTSDWNGAVSYQMICEGSGCPTEEPTMQPTDMITISPTFVPSFDPTEQPTFGFTEQPTIANVDCMSLGSDAEIIECLKNRVDTLEARLDTVES